MVMREIRVRVYWSVPRAGPDNNRDSETVFLGDRALGNSSGVPPIP